MHILSLARLGAYALVCCLATPAAFAQPWPARPIRVIVPYPPGGVSDLVTRAID